MYEVQNERETLFERWIAECPEGGPASEHPTPEQLQRDALIDAGYDPFTGETPEQYLARTKVVIS